MFRGLKALINNVIGRKPQEENPVEPPHPLPS